MDKPKKLSGLRKFTIVITIILVVIIAVTIAICVYNANEKKTAYEFITAMTEIQDAVDKLCNEKTVSEINSLGLDYVSAPLTAKAVLDDVIESGQAGELNCWFSTVDNDTTNYRYFDTNAISEVLGVSNTSTAIWLNPVSKNVVAVEGVTYKKVAYHRQYDLSAGQTLEEPNINTNFNLAYDVKTYDNKADIVLLEDGEETTFAKVKYYKYDSSTATYGGLNLLKDVSRIEITESGIYKVEATTYDDSVKTESEIEIMIVNKPALVSGMIPVDENGNEITTDEGKEDWYNYSIAEQKWANAKLTDGSVYVWIPRFAYNINSEDETIDIIFLSETTDEGTDGSELPSTYRISPAFQDGSKTGYSNGEWDSELTGFWIAKYPTSAQTVNDTAMPYNVNQKNSIMKNLTANKAFTLCRNMEYKDYFSTYFTEIENFAGASGTLSYGVYETDNNNIDTHLTKNSEWGAVAYLSYSQYGSGAEATSARTSATSYSDETVSSTNNSTGVYGMTNSVKEIVSAGVSIAGVFNSDETSTKYATVYQTEKNSIVGDGIADLSSWIFNSTYLYPDSSSSIFSRGGNTEYKDIFGYGKVASDNTGTYTFRPVLIVE